MWLYKIILGSFLLPYYLMGFGIGFTLVGTYNLLVAATLSLNLAEEPMLYGNDNAVSKI